VWARLALEAAARHTFAFLHGVCFVSLVGEQASERLLDILSDRLGCYGPHNRTSHEQVFRFLREREMLLLLDNFENVLAAPGHPRQEVTAILEALFQQAPKVKVLVTSREPLHLQWEWLLRLEGLKCSEFRPP